MTAQELKNSILQLAIQGKLVKQDPNDEPATVLLEKIKEERKKLIKEKKIKKEKYSEIYKDPSDNHYYEKFEDGTINDITEEIPFDIPDTWKWCRIENFEEINLGFTYKPDYTSEGVYFLSVKDISGGKIDFSKAKKVSRETYDKASYGSKPHKGDILFGRVGTMGKPQIIETDEEFCIFVSLGFFRDHLDIMNKHYIVLWMESLLFQEQINRNVKGAAQKNLNTGWLKKFLIPIPPLKEQQRIIEKYENLLPYISRYDDIYERLEKINNNYKEDLKKSILQYAIQGKLVQQDQNDEPADILINKILSEKRELIKSKQIKKENLSVIYKNNTDNQFYEKFDDGTIKNITEEIPFEIPDNWAWTRLENLTTKQIKRGKSPKYINKSNVYVFSQKCNQKDGIISLEQSKFLDEKTLKKYDDTDYIIKSDIVINSTGNGTLGRIGIIKDRNIYSNKVVTDSHVTLVRVFDEIEADYIFYFLKCNQKYLELKATGSTNQTELSPEVIKKMMVPLPNNIEQQKIKNKIEKIFNTIKTAE